MVSRRWGRAPAPTVASGGNRVAVAVALCRHTKAVTRFETTQCSPPKDPAPASWWTGKMCWRLREGQVTTTRSRPTGGRRASTAASAPAVLMEIAATCPGSGAEASLLHCLRPIVPGGARRLPRVGVGDRRQILHRRFDPHALRPRESAVHCPARKVGGREVYWKSDAGWRCHRKRWLGGGRWARSGSGWLEGSSC
jgi:hypothetical protein